MVEIWQRVQNPPLLSDKVVHIWRVSLRTTPIGLYKFWKLLSEDEQIRANRFVPIQAKENFIVCRGALRLLLSNYLGIMPKKVLIRRGKYGKPYVVQSEKNQSVQFNVSHSKDVALLAFTLSNQIGVDIEYVSKDFSFKELVSRFFSTEEKNTLFSLPTPLQRKAFFVYWTKKEAFIKALGNGLSIALHKFDVAITSNKRDYPLEVSIPNQAPADRSYSIYELTPIMQYVAAFAIDSPPRKIYQWVFN